MRTAVVIGNYSRSLLTFRGQLMEALAEGGHRVVGCAPAIEEDTAQALREKGIEPVSIRLSRSGFSPWSDLRTLWEMQRLFWKLRPDLVLTYTMKPVVYGNAAARWTGVSRRVSIVAGLGSFFGEEVSAGLRTAVSRNLFGAALRSTTHIIFQNPDDRDDLCSLGLIESSHPSTVVSGSGVDVTYYRPARFPDRPTALFAARLIAEKGIRQFVGAARALREKHPDWRFVVAGWIDDKSPTAIGWVEVEEWVARGWIEFLGPVEDIRVAMGDATVFVLPSYYREGVPRTSLEALAMGRPIVTTDAPGCREAVIDGKNGVRVPPRDVDALTQAMETVLGDRARAARMGHESRVLAETRFDVRRVNRDVLHALDWAP